MLHVLVQVRLLQQLRGFIKVVRLRITLFLQPVHLGMLLVVLLDVLFLLKQALMLILRRTAHQRALVIVGQIAFLALARTVQVAGVDVGEAAIGIGVLHPHLFACLHHYRLYY